MNRIIFQTKHALASYTGRLGKGHDDGLLISTNIANKVMRYLLKARASRCITLVPDFKNYFKN